MEETMDDLQPLEFPMYQPLWRIKHDGEDALATKWPDAPVLLFTYQCTSATDFEDVQEMPVQEAPTERTEVGWFYKMDRELVKSICTSEMRRAGAESAGDWVSGVTSELLKREILFWEGDDEKELISFGALDEPPVEPDPPSETTDDVDEITYESGSEDMEIEWF